MTSKMKPMYELLPTVYRLRDMPVDTHGNRQLESLLAILSQQTELLAEDLEQLWDDQFIETCAGWVVPYIGDLIGYRTLHRIGAKGDSVTARAEVANTIAYRRRKGTGTMLEQVARDVTGWNARVVEMFQRLLTSQSMKHLRLNHYATVDVRHPQNLEHVDGPFDMSAHAIDVRSIAKDQGRYNIPNIGIFLWRLRAYPLEKSPAFRVDTRRYLISPLGNNAPLFTNPQPEDEIAHLADFMNVPMPISRRMMHHNLEGYYGAGTDRVVKSLLLEVDGTVVPDPAQPTQKVSDVIEVCNLSDLVDTGGSVIGWAHLPTNKIAIDPVLGRIAFPPTSTPRSVRVSFHYGFSAHIGGGQYDRGESSLVSPTTGERLVKVPNDRPTILAALTDLTGGGGIVEITDNGRYEEALTMTLDAGKALTIRAANKCRPTIVLAGPLQILGSSDSSLKLSGLLLTGHEVDVTGDMRQLELEDCTLVPGRRLKVDGTPTDPGKSSLIVHSSMTAVSILRCIVGALRVADGVSEVVSIRDSILDATSTDLIAYSGLDGSSAGRTLSIEASTIIGTVHTARLKTVSNSIFHGRGAIPVRSTRRQGGCVRFSYMPSGSLVPRRYRCQPDLAVETEVAKLEKARGSAVPQAERDLIQRFIESRVVPSFTSLRYGDPGYAQLHGRCPLEIAMGADDEAEMGVFHHLKQPQRAINLQTRLREYLPFGLEAGIIHAS
jgi:hypothetical protein